MRKRTRYVVIGVTLLSSLFFTGCGISSFSGSGPVSQPITQPNTHDNHNHSSGSGQTGKSGSSSSSQTGSAKGSTKGSTTGSVTGSKNGSSSNSSTNGTTASKGSNTGSSNQSGSSKTKTVTIHVGGNQGVSLASVPVSANGASNSFVPVSQSVTSVQLPSGWILQSTSYASAGSTIKWINPKDTSQFISEAIQPFSRNLSDFYSSNSGAASWLVSNQVVQFTFSNPSNPYPDQGILANVSSGGSIRLDVYLPISEKGIAQQIINSFVGLSN